MVTSRHIRREKQVQRSRGPRLRSPLMLAHMLNTMLGSKSSAMRRTGTRRKSGRCCKTVKPLIKNGSTSKRMINPIYQRSNVSTTKPRRSRANVSVPSRRKTLPNSKQLTTCPKSPRVDLYPQICTIMPHILNQMVIPGVSNNLWKTKSAMSKKGTKT